MPSWGAHAGYHKGVVAVEQLVEQNAVEAGIWEKVVQPRLEALTVDA
jgi:hypothetical protein